MRSCATTEGPCRCAVSWSLVSCCTAGSIRKVPFAKDFWYVNDVVFVSSVEASGCCLHQQHREFNDFIMETVRCRWQLHHRIQRHCDDVSKFHRCRSCQHVSDSARLADIRHLLLCQCHCCQRPPPQSLCRTLQLHWCDANLFSPWLFDTGGLSVFLHVYLFLYVGLSVSLFIVFCVLVHINGWTDWAGFQK